MGLFSILQFGLGLGGPKQQLLTIVATIVTTIAISEISQFRFRKFRNRFSLLGFSILVFGIFNLVVFAFYHLQKNLALGSQAKASTLILTEI